jgi:acyl transferase domain-containing protein/NAD(P)-dependent dehydrogenase (short-subunit alcohol dehydrogenase family)/acyl carrier protein
VMKMVLAMRNELLPRTLHVDEPSPHVDWSQGAVSLLREAVAWPAGGRPRRAAVSSFGVSGTNAHVIIEEPPQVEPSRAGAQQIAAAPGGVPAGGASNALDGASAGASASVDGAWSCGVVPLVVSGRGVDGLCGQAERLGKFLSGSSDTGLLDVGFSLLQGRAALDDRGVVLGTDHAGLVGGLDVLAAGAAAEGVVRGVGVLRGVARGGKPVFVFPGQGAQWEGMALQLLDSSTVFRDSIRACEGAFEGLVEWRIEDVLRGVDGAPGLELVDVVQPVSFAVMVALAGLWRSFGAQPGAVVGHSQGEIAAACVAGGLSLQDAARVVVLRSQLIGEVLAGHGGMVSVALALEQVESRLERWGTRLSVAAMNGPSAVVVSGENDALQEFLRECEGEEVWARRVAVDYASHSAAVDGLRDRLVEALEGLEPVSGDVPFFSTATGGFVDTAQLDAEYWYRSLREPVKFAQAVRELAVEANAFIEVSPHPVLRVALQDTLEDLGVAERIGVLGSLQRDEGGFERFLRSLAEAWVVGVPVDWHKFFAGSGAQSLELPTYAFQRRRYWVESQAEMGDVTAAGLGATGHPLLGAAVRVAGRDEWLFSRRLGLATHPWISDHAVLGTVLLPGTGFVELALAAARQVGCEAVEELTLQAPLVLGEDSVQLQVLIGEADDERQQRPITIYSCGQGSTEPGEEVTWVCHASGTLTQAAGDADESLERAVTEAWPPAGAEPVEVEFLYDVLAEAGLEYGPMFQGVKTAWRRGAEVFAEVAFDEQHAGAEQSFGVHPALFDAALHAGFALQDDAPAPSELQLPFSFSGVRLHGEGRAALRVFAVAGSANELSLVALDGTGAPVLSMRSLATRPIDPNLLAGARLAGSDSLFALGWTEVSAPTSDGPPPRFALLGELEVESLEAERYTDLQALDAALAEGAPVPDVVLAAAPSTTDADPIPQAARSATARTLELLQAWLAQERLARTRLVIVSSGAMAVEGGELGDLAMAPVWGLLRSAQSENPDRFSLVDLDAGRSSGEISWAELCAFEEPQLAIRNGKVLAPRLTRVPPPVDAPAASFDAESTVLITGGTSGLGALLARHLASAHGVRQLVLTSRRGPAAEGAGELVEELAGLGCEAQVVACDVSDRAQCAALIESIPAAHPLRGVVHAAGVLEDALLGALSVEQLERVMSPKVDGAFHLHELTAHLELSEFVLFSSAAGLIGSPGQANYAAGNAFLDALAQYRRAQGLAGRSLAWGLWAPESGMTSALADTDMARLGRLGVMPLEGERGLELFDMTRALDQALLAPVALDTRVLRSLARVGMLPALLRGVVRVPARRADGESLARRLSSVPQAEWESTVLDLVQKEVAAVLGRDSAREIDPQATFTDLGFDSLGAVELRNRLNQLTGLRLPATLVFDYPTPVRVAAHMLEEAVRNGAKPEALVDAEIDKLQARLATLGSEESERKRIAVRLRAMLEELQAPPSTDGVAVAERIQSASAEEVLEFIDRELEAY